MAWDAVTAQTFPSTEVTHLHLLRHGKVDTGGQRLAYGHSDFPLSDVGVRQGAALSAFAAAQIPKPDRVLSSDLLRCVQTARPIAERLGVPLVTTPALREQHMGEWEGQPWSALTASDVVGVRRYWTDYAHARPPGGESMSDLADRVDGWLSEEWASLRGGRSVVVAHAGVLRAMLCRALGVNIDQALRFTPLPGTHTWLMIAQAGAVIQTLGERPLAQEAGPAGVAHTAQGAPPGGRCVALCGSAGTGKSTLGRALSASLDVPYIPEGMRARLESGLILSGMSLVELRALVEELWVEQLAAEDAALAGHGGFIADRSPLDFAAFWLTYRFSSDAAATDDFFAQVRARLPLYDRVVVLPWGALPLVDDGVRSPNPWVQRQFQATVEGLAMRELDPKARALMPPITSLEARVRWVRDLIAESGTAHAHTWRGAGA